MTEEKGPYGGKREGAGRKSVYKDKVSIQKPLILRVSEAEWEVLSDGIWGQLEPRIRTRVLMRLMEGSQLDRVIQQAIRDTELYDLTAEGKQRVKRFAEMLSTEK